MFGCIEFANIRIWIIYIFKLFDRGLYFFKIVVNTAGDIAGVKAAATTVAYTANADDKIPAALTNIACGVTACAADTNNKTPAVLAGITYNALGTVIAGNSLNCRFIYVCPGKADAWLSIIVYLCLLVYSLLYGSAGSLGLLDLVNGTAYSLAPNSLVSELTNNRPNIPLFSLFWRTPIIFTNCNTLYIEFNKNILLNSIFKF